MKTSAARIQLPIARERAFLSGRLRFSLDNKLIIAGMERAVRIKYRILVIS